MSCIFVRIHCTFFYDCSTTMVHASNTNFQFWKLTIPRRNSYSYIPGFFLFLGRRRHKFDCLCAICVLKRRRREREENERIAKGQTGVDDNKLAQENKQEVNIKVQAVNLIIDFQIRKFIPPFVL